MDSYRCPCGYSGLADLTREFICGNCKAQLRVTQHYGGHQTLERRNERGEWCFVDTDERRKGRVIT